MIDCAYAVNSSIKIPKLWTPESVQVGSRVKVKCEEGGTSRAGREAQRPHTSPLASLPYGCS